MLKVFLKRIMSILLGSLFLLINQIQAAEQERLLSGAEQQTILIEFLKLLKSQYVQPDLAADYVSALNLAIKNGEFINEISASKFINKSNQVIQKTHPDKHLGLLMPKKFSKVMAMFHPEQQKNTGSEKHQPQHSSHKMESHHSDKQANDNNSAYSNREDAEERAAQGLRKIGIGRVSEISRDGLNQTGFIEILRFDGSLKAQQFLERVFSTFTESDGIIIDLRLCEGGDAEMVKVLSSYFFSTETHLLSSVMGVDEDGHRQSVKRLTKPNRLSQIFAKKPLKILISKKSFSAAESFAFGMQAIGRAELVGDTTGGGGYMNDFYALPGGFGASISVGRTYDPRTGKDWQGVGVVPDVKIDAEIALITALDRFTIASGKLAKISENVDQYDIYKQMQSYSNAWYGAKAGVIQDLLMDSFQGVYSDKGLKEPLIINKAQLVKRTAEGKGTRRNKIHYNRIIVDIAVKKDTATVTLILRETVHKMSLMKIAGDWLIKVDNVETKSHG